MNQRGGIKISTFIISMLVMSLMVVTFSSFFSEVANKYPVSYDGETNASIEAFNQFTSIQNTTQSIENTLFDASDGSSLDLLGAFLGAGFNVLKIAKESVKAFGNLINHASEQIGLSSAFTSIILTIVTVLILFSIIGVLVGRDI